MAPPECLKLLPPGVACVVLQQMISIYIPHKIREIDSGQGRGGISRSRLLLMEKGICMTVF